MFNLRDLSLADKDMIRSWRNHEEVAKYMYTDHEISVAEHEAWFKKVLADPSCRYWVIQYGGGDSGLLSISQIDWHNSRCYWAFYVNPEARVRGLGSFAEYSVLRYVFEELKLNRLCGEVLNFNQAVLNMHKKFGFVQEGILRQHVLKHGQWHDVVCVGMLRQEWEAMKLEIEERLRSKQII
jgi:hypothetical protein